MKSFSYHHCDDDDDDDAADDDDDDDDDAADDDDDYDNDDVDDDNEEDWSQVNTMIVHGGNNEGHNESFHQEVKPSKPPLTLPGRQVFYHHSSSRKAEQHITIMILSKKTMLGLFLRNDTDVSGENLPQPGSTWSKTQSQTGLDLVK